MPHADLRAAVPLALAQWLDAQAIDGSGDFGEPGFPALRTAWATEAAPDEAFLTEVAEWVAQRDALIAGAERTYARLVELDGFSSNRIPGWYFKPWAQVLLSMTWDDRLADAIDAADAYCVDIHP
jgi:hypothetical protein